MNARSIVEDYATACRYLLGLKTRGVSLGLSRMTRLLDLLGNPERKVPCIHIAGTNGKGSVAAMLESIFRAAGWRTGLYTSPHLVRLGERVQVNRRPLSEEFLVDYVRELQPILAEIAVREGEGSVPTYFELMTAIAFMHFDRSACDIAMIEVGLGGRIDATNVVIPEVSVITSIGFDHVEQLGNSVAAIATEKAGIIKSAKPVVIGRLPVEAEKVVRSIAQQRDAHVVSVAHEFGDDLTIYPPTNLAGGFQRANAATAVLAARAMPASWRLSEAAINDGLACVDWPGRWQRFELSGRTVFVDSSHNAEGAEHLDENMTVLLREFGRAPVVVAGVLGIGRARSLVPVVCKHGREIHFVRPAQGRACTFEELESVVPPAYVGPTFRSSLDDLFPAAVSCSIGSEGDVVVVTGSIYLAGEVLARVEPARGPYEGHLQDF